MSRIIKILYFPRNNFKLKKYIFILILIYILFGCVTSFEIKEKKPLFIDNYTESKIFHIHVTYYNEDDIGLTKSIDEIDARVLSAKYNGLNYYKWLDYKIRTYKVGSAIENRMEYKPDTYTPWTTYQPAIGFEYTMDGMAFDNKGNLAKLPNMDSIPRDMVGFQFYISIIDFHTWDIYRHMFFGINDTREAQLKEIGDVYSHHMENKTIPLMNWTNLTSDFSLEGGSAHGIYLADIEQDSMKIKLIYFEQNQRLKQYVYGNIGRIQFKMPYDGTTRFYGFLYLDETNNLIKANMNEYVYGKVKAPMFITVLVHTKRDYFIERENY
jgi:hypothetical protein